MKSFTLLIAALSLFFSRIEGGDCSAMHVEDKQEHHLGHQKNLCYPLCVTSGTAYTDIDALACAVAFAELYHCSAVLPGEFNSTVTESVRQWDFTFSREFTDECAVFVIVDVSNPAYIPKHIKHGQIAKVFDHHFGFEDYWNSTGNIEAVGACATLIFELFKDTTPSKTTANLLYTAILANTLNFRANVTTPRDIAAFEKLKDFIELPETWIRDYYTEVELQVLKHFDLAVKNDTKILGNGWAIAQIELYDPSLLLKDAKFLESLEDCMKEYSDWLLTMPSISEGKNYFITNSHNIQRKISEDIRTEWAGLCGVSDKLYLRKEILKITNLK